MRLFISYAHADEKYRAMLETHLASLRNDGIVDVWHDRKIAPGNEWAEVIHDELSSCELILLLISPDFLASTYCYAIEMRVALERHERATAIVVPIIVRPCEWQKSPFAKLQVLPRDAKPITKWGNRDEVFAQIASGIRRIVTDRGHAKEATKRDIDITTTDNVDEGGILTTTVTSSIDLLIDRDFDSYSEDDQRKLLDAIGHILGTGADLRVGRKRKGSVRLKLSHLTPEQAERLYWAIERGELAGHGVIAATVSDDSPLRSQPTADSEPLPLRLRGVDLAKRIRSLEVELRNVNEQRHEAQLLNELGACYCYSPIGAVDQNTQTAIDCFERALKIWESLRDNERVANLISNLAFAYSLHGDDPSRLRIAIMYYERSARTYSELKLPLEYAKTLHDLALTIAKVTDMDRQYVINEVRRNFDMAIDVLKQFGHTSDVQKAEASVEQFEDSIRDST